MQLEDCEAAFKWLQDEAHAAPPLLQRARLCSLLLLQAATLGADLSKVSIAGTSAGGHIAALLLARRSTQKLKF